MYAAIRQAKAKPGKAEELAARIKEGVIPIISDVPGFMAYYVVYAPDDTLTAIGVFNNFEAAEESNRRALAWIEQNLGPLLTGPVTAAHSKPLLKTTLAVPDWRSRVSLRVAPPTTAPTPICPSMGSSMTPALTTDACTEPSSPAVVKTARW